MCCSYPYSQTDNQRLPGQNLVQGVIGGPSVTFNPYPYAQNNPVNMVDPNGEFAWFAAGLFVFGGGMDVGFQMLFEGRSLDEVNFGRAAVSGLTTVAGGAFGKALHAASISGRAAFAAGAVADFGVGVAADRYLIGDSWGTAVASNAIGFGVGEFLGYAGRGIGRGIANSRFGRAAGATGSVCHSFSADTLVSTPDGDIAISEIVVGDTVYAYNEETGEVEEQDVLHVFIHDDDAIVTLTIDGEVIETTPWHPFYTDEGWTDAGDLEPGDLILALDGNYGTVERVVIVGETQTMYDLDVETVDTFAVGDGAWVVHNSDVCILGVGFPDQNIMNHVKTVVGRHPNQAVIGIDLMELPEAKYWRIFNEMWETNVDLSNFRGVGRTNFGSPSLIHTLGQQKAMYSFYPNPKSIPSTVNC